MMPLINADVATIRIWPVLPENVEPQGSAAGQQSLGSAAGLGLRKIHVESIKVCVRLCKRSHT